MVYWGTACLDDTMCMHSINSKGIAVRLDMSVAHALPVLTPCRVQTHVTSALKESL